MSSLVFHTQPDMAIVATDTLAVHESGAPSHFTTKAVLVPHLRMIIAGTGVAGFSSRWFVHVNDGMTVRGIDHLDQHTQPGLCNLWAGYRKEVGFPTEFTTTIYHIGFSEVTGEAVAFAYRSENNFASERLGHGTRMKPEGKAEPGYELPQGIVQIMESQREIQASKPPHERVYIGGEIQLIVMDGYVTTCGRLHRFSDFDETEAAIYENFTR